MRPFLHVLVVFAASLLLSAVALAKDEEPSGSETNPTSLSARTAGPLATFSTQDFDEQYSSGTFDAAAASPGEPSPPPPPASPNTPAASGAAAPAGVPPGQWVWTAQYGWTWMPYADPYTYVPADGYGAPYMYVYCPTFGWSWLLAPWVWGLGPWPHFGVFGVAHFGWYQHGWWRTPGRWHLAAGASSHGGFREGFRREGGFPSARATPLRGGLPARAARFGDQGRMSGPAFGGGGSAFRGARSRFQGGFADRAGNPGRGGPGFRWGHPGSSGGKNGARGGWGRR